MRLPGSDHWDDGSVRQRIRFLADASHAIPPLLAAIAGRARFAEPELEAQLPNDALFAAADAAELAFAIGDVAWGLALCRTAAAGLESDGQRYTPMQILLAATLGAIAGGHKLVWDGGPAAEIWYAGEQVKIFPFEFDSAAYNVALMQRASAAQSALAFDRRLHPESFASDAGHVMVGNGGWQRRKILWRGFSATPEGLVATAPYPPSYRGLDRIAASRELALERFSRLRAADETFLPRRGGLIDWSLLALWTGYFRHHGPHIAHPRAQTEAGAFIRALAAAIAESEDPEFVFAPDEPVVPR
jgi:hypothetical protein